MRVKNSIIFSSISDFQIGKRTFEIGRKSKGKKQIETAEEGYVVKDQIEFSSAIYKRKNTGTDKEVITHAKIISHNYIKFAKGRRGASVAYYCPPLFSPDEAFPQNNARNKRQPVQEDTDGTRSERVPSVQENVYRVVPIL